MLPKCFHCNGYYGPSFGQPVCSTCHMFLYPDDASLHSSSFQCSVAKVEDGDSGNEEPREPSECHASNDLDTSFRKEVCRSSSSESEPQCSGSLQPNFTGSSFYSENTDVVSSTGPSVIRRLPPTSEGNNLASSLEPVEWVPSTSNQLESLTDWNDFVPNNSNIKIDRNIHDIPPEVLLVVFQLLDEMSLWSVGQVCRRWHELVQNCSLQWQVFVQRRWPLFNPIYKVSDWHKIFTNLIESAPCQLCLFRMPYNSIPQTDEDSWRTTRLINEQRTLLSDPPEGITASPLDKMSLHWQASIRGPSGSPYQGGTFFLYIQIPSKYPLSPPLVRFVTRIFHPNVSRHGDVGIDSIQHNWTVAITISKVLVSIQSLLTDPYTKVCMEPRIGEMYDENRMQFDRIARAWTWCHAMHDAIDPVTMVTNYMHRLTSDAVGSLKLSEDSKFNLSTAGLADEDSNATS